MTPFMEPLHILGGGAVGLFLASSVRSAFPSYPLRVMLRPHHRHRMDPTGSITVSLMNRGRPRMVDVPATTITNHSRKRPIRNLVLTTKAYQAHDAVRSIVDLLAPERLRIVVLCNGGLAVRQELRHLLDQKGLKGYEVVMGTTTHGVIQEPPDDDLYHLERVGHGTTLLGGLDGLAQLWDHCGLNCSSLSVDNMEVVLWKKLAANCVCNPLTAIWNVSNGELSDNPAFDTIMGRIIEEVVAVAQSTNPELKDRLTADGLVDFTQEVIRDNSGNKSSMFQDILHRRQTEIEQLNGFVVGRGRVVGVDCPANEELLNQIVNLSSTPWRHH